MISYIFGHPMRLWIIYLGPSLNCKRVIWPFPYIFKDIFSKVRENCHFQTPQPLCPYVNTVPNVYFFVKGETMKRNTITIVGQRNQFTKDWVELEVDWRKKGNPSGKKIPTIHMRMKMIKISVLLNIQANLEIRKILRISKSLLEMRNAMIIMNLKVSCENFKVWW